MTEVTVFRMYLLRATYLLLVIGIGQMVWPGLIAHSDAWAVKYGDTMALLAGVQLLSILGLRYPLRMLPVLLFELTWKAVWLATIALPLWRAGRIDAGTAESITACTMGVVVCVIAIPWPYVVATYIRAPAERWR